MVEGVFVCRCLDYSRMGPETRRHNQTPTLTGRLVYSTCVMYMQCMRQSGVIEGLYYCHSILWFCLCSWMRSTDVLVERLCLRSCRTANVWHLQMYSRNGHRTCGNKLLWVPGRSLCKLTAGTAGCHSRCVAAQSTLAVVIRAAVDGQQIVRCSPSSYCACRQVPVARRPFCYVHVECLPAFTWQALMIRSCSNARVRCNPDAQPAVLPCTMGPWMPHMAGLHVQVPTLPVVGIVLPPTRANYWLCHVLCLAEYHCT